MAKKKPVKERKPKLDFAERLAIKLRESRLGEVEEDSFSDNSARWVQLKIGDKSLVFSFDMKGEKIDNIALYKDVVEVVDQEQLWSTDKKEKKRNDGTQKNIPQDCSRSPVRCICNGRVLNQIDFDS